MSYKNVVAAIGTYEKDGQKKYVNRTVGQLLQTQNGTKLKLDASFNPAGCMKNEDGSVWLSLFEPTPKNKNAAPQAPQQAPQAPNQGYQQAPQAPNQGYQQAPRQPSPNEPHPEPHEQGYYNDDIVF